MFGDTDKVQFGMGTYGSRSLVVGGAALSKASDKVIAKGKKIAAHLLESSEEDIEFEAGDFKVAGTDRKKAFADIALAAYVPHNYPLEVLEPGLEEQAYYDPVNFTYPGGAHIAEVEIDPETCTLRARHRHHHHLVCHYRRLPRHHRPPAEAARQPRAGLAGRIAWKSGPAISSLLASSKPSTASSTPSTASISNFQWRLLLSARPIGLRQDHDLAHDCRP